MGVTQEVGEAGSRRSYLGLRRREMTADRIHCPPGEIHAVGNGIHCPQDENPETNGCMNAVAHGIHCPPGEIHATGDGIHCPQDEIDETNGCMNAIGGRIHPIERRVNLMGRPVAGI